MRTNTDITIYHVHPDAGSRNMIYIRHHVAAAHWFTRQEVTVTDAGLKSADQVFIRIPEAECEGYVQPHE